jgi:RimJ/RimL family protein N-acetyltransferase
MPSPILRCAVPRDIQVRRIRPDEGPLLRELRLRSLADAPDAFGQSAADAAARPADEWRQVARITSDGDRRAWLFAVDLDANEEVVGLVNGRRRPPGTLMLFSMWVAPAHRRTGVGRELIGSLEEWARGWGVERTVLWVFGGNEPAIRFYERLGFTVEQDTDDAATGRGYGALAMSRAVMPRA